MRPIGPRRIEKKRRADMLSRHMLTSSAHHLMKPASDGRLLGRPERPIRVRPAYHHLKCRRGQSHLLANSDVRRSVTSIANKLLAIQENLAEPGSKGHYWIPRISKQSTNLYSDLIQGQLEFALRGHGFVQRDRYCQRRSNSPQSAG